MATYVKKFRPSAEPSVEKILTKGEYASFKIKIFEPDFGDLMDPQFWPTGVAVNEWRFRRATPPPQ